MRDLRFVSLSDDRRRVLLDAPDGEVFAVAVDDALRSAVTSGRPAVDAAADDSSRDPAGEAVADRGPNAGQPTPAPPSPREIQARIRGGETAEHIAEQAGVPVDLVRRFEGPVLDERAHMVRAAQSAKLRRRGDQPADQLGALVTARLEAHGVAPDLLDWDSWLRDDATWLVELRYRAGETPKRAQWVFDPKRRVVSSADDEARWLSDGHERPEPVRERPSVPRLVPAPALVDDEDEPDVAAPGAGAGAGAGDEEDAREDARDDYGNAPDNDADPDPETDPKTDEGRQSAARGAGEAGEAREARARRHAERLIGATDRQAVRDGVAPGKRAAVPTWDEIVFGTRRRD